MMANARFNVGAIAFHAWSFPQAVSFVLDEDCTRGEDRHSHPGTAIHFANAYNIALAERDNLYRNLMDDSDYVFIDGTPVVWAARSTQKNMKSKWTRIYGPDFMRAVLEQSNQNHRHFLLGGTQTVLECLQNKIAEGYPLAQIVGTYSPPFGDQVNDSELETRDHLIRQAAPTHIWVGLGTPKQDYEVVRLANKYPAKCLAVGAAFNYLSGNLKESPKLLQKIGLQWLHRFIHEPRRLFWRYIWGNPVFVYSVMQKRNSTNRRRN